MKVSELVKSAKIISKSVFGKKDKYILKFNHEDDGCWYIDFPNWPLDHHNLMMVAGADDLCDALSDDGNSTTVIVVPKNKEDKTLEDKGFIKLTQEEHGLTEGSTYSVSGLLGFNKDIWLCPVTLFVLGKYPKYIYLKKSIVPMEKCSME